MNPNVSFLRRVLLVDAVTSGAMGLLLVALAGVLADMLGLPAGLLREAGIVLLPFAAFTGQLHLSDLGSIFKADLPADSVPVPSTVGRIGE